VRKILIIKLGYSETLDPEISATTSLGDVLRTTFILSYFKKDDVSWVVDEKALPLLQGNRFIRRILLYNLETVLQLQREKFDVVVNLEKVPGVCALADSMSARQKFGFRFDEETGLACGHNGSEKSLSLSLSRRIKRKNRENSQEVVAAMLGHKWNRERYILGYRPRTKVRFDVGLNWTIGPKWKNKMWPKNNWQLLHDALSPSCRVSWQQGIGDLREYMDWINQCRLIVTNDSLGLHLAIALRKKIVALFGPSSPHEVHFYGLGRAIVPPSCYDCVPCLKRECGRKKFCMGAIQPKYVAQEIASKLK